MFLMCAQFLVAEGKFPGVLMLCISVFLIYIRLVQMKTQTFVFFIERQNFHICDLYLKIVRLVNVRR